MSRHRAPKKSGILPCVFRENGIFAVRKEGQLRFPSAMHPYKGVSISGPAFRSNLMAEAAGAS
jgi:hypothetical protein